MITLFAINQSPSPPINGSFQLTFTQGFIAGQLSILLLIVCFVRYVVFEDPKSSQAKAKSVETHRKPYRLSDRRPSKTYPRKLSLHERSLPSVEPEVLSRIPYDLSNHPPESTDWLNVLLAQAIVTYRGLVNGLDNDPTLPKGNKAKQMVEEALNFARGESPGMISIDYITVTEVDFGSEYPTCTNARVRPADETGRMRVEIDIDYSDHVTLAIETKVVVNFPTNRFAVLPISLGLTLNQLSATIMAEIPPTAIPLPMQIDPSAPSPAILMSLDPDFTLSTTTTSLLGSRAKLQDIPKIEQLISGRLRAWIVDNLVWPRVRVLKLPGLGNKGSVEDAADGEGEYVWVEGVTPKEKSSVSNLKEPNPPKNPVGEADEDEGPNWCLPTSSDEPPAQEVFDPPVPILTSPPNSHSRNLSGSSKTPKTPFRSSSDFNLATSTFKRQKPSGRTDHHATPPDSDAYLNQRTPGGLPLSARSIASYIDNNNNTPSLSTNYNRNQTFSTCQDKNAHEWSQQFQRTNGMKNSDHLGNNNNNNRSAEDQARWARTGGMSGVPMALYGSQFPNVGFGLRERIRDAERRSKPNTPTVNHFVSNPLNLQQ